MSRGLGWVQQACLQVISEYEAEGDELPTTYSITAAVYEVKPDKNGNRWVNDAQHVAVKRALGGLQRKGRIIGFRTQRAVVPGVDGRPELCHHWMTERRAQKFVKDELMAAVESRHMGFRGNTDLADGVVKKMKAIGMKVLPERGLDEI